MTVVQLHPKLDEGDVKHLVVARAQVQKHTSMTRQQQQQSVDAAAAFSAPPHLAAVAAAVTEAFFSTAAASAAVKQHERAVGSVTAAAGTAKPCQQPLWSVAATSADAAGAAHHD